MVRWDLTSASRTDKYDHAETLAAQSLYAKTEFADLFVIVTSPGMHAAAKVRDFAITALPRKMAKT
jgi:hypothetical protein